MTISHYRLLQAERAVAALEHARAATLQRGLRPDTGTWMGRPWRRATCPAAMGPLRAGPSFPVLLAVLATGWSGGCPASPSGDRESGVGLTPTVEAGRCRIRGGHYR